MSSYTDRRKQILNDLGPEDRAVFDEAYATASLAMQLAETAYRASIKSELRLGKILQHLHINDISEDER